MQDSASAHTNKPVLEIVHGTFSYVWPKSLPKKKGNWPGNSPD